MGKLETPERITVKSAYKELIGTMSSSKRVPYKRTLLYFVYSNERNVKNTVTTFGGKYNNIQNIVRHSFTIINTVELTSCQKDKLTDINHFSKVYRSMKKSSIKLYTRKSQTFCVYGFNVYV